jgi:SdrD B-like domain
MLKSATLSKESRMIRTSLQRGILILGLAAAGSLLRSLPILAAPAIGGTKIENQATGTYLDGDIPGDTTQNAVSNIVSVQVAEVAGISITAQTPTDAPATGSYPNNATGTPLTAGLYQSAPGIHLGDIVYFDFVISNVGNDPTQFVIPSTATLTGGGTLGQLQIVEYNGTALATVVNVPTNFNATTNSTGALLSGVSAANNGSISAGHSIKVRVPVVVTSTTTINVQLGDTTNTTLGDTNPASNKPYVANGNLDVFTKDNPSPVTPLAPAINNEVIGAPANGEREASAISPDAIILGKDISGTVFEDKNYGGGSGRDKTTASGTGVNGATVELYNSAGKFIRSTTTSTTGTYSFPSVPAGDFYVRVVNNTVKSNRPGSVTGLFPVQTFTTDASGTAGTVTNVTDRVGGEHPDQEDTGVGGTGAVLGLTGTQFTTAGGSAAVNGYVQSLAKVNAGTAVVSGLDFGFNFDTIVNTNNAGQGSLRQFVLNSNALTNTTTNLTQAGRPAGKEVSIFMIADGATHNGLRAGLSNQLIGNRALITLLSPLTITDADTSIDGSTQTNVSDSNSQSLGNGSTTFKVGKDNLSLTQILAPEVEIVGSSTVANGIDITGASATIKNIAIHGFGAASSNQGDILLRGATPTIINNAIGTTALSFSAPSKQSQSGIIIGTGSSVVSITNNLIGYTNERGILGGTSAAPLNLAGLVISGNEIRKTGNGTGTTDQHGGIELYPSTSGSVSITGNLIAETGTDSGIEINSGAGNASTTTFLIQNNSLTSNGSGSKGFGIVLQGNATTDDLSGIKIDKNIFDANRLGITSRQSNVTISGNEVHGSIGGYGIGIESGKLGNKITQNSVYANAGVGIDIATATNANGLTANNGAVLNTLSNNGIDYPVITSTAFDTTSNTLSIKGYVGKTSAGNAVFDGVTLEFFLADNSDADQTGEVIVGDGKTKSHGEGKTYIGFCKADSLGRFGTTANPCDISNAALSSTNFNDITATATDSSNNTSEFGATPSSRAKLVLAKRVTAVTSGSTTTSYTNYVNDATTTDDDVANWPGVNTFVLGAISGISVKPGDEIEYTIYYRNAGENRISQAKICDQLNSNLIYQTDFNAANVGKGIVLTEGSGAAQYLTGSGTDTDRGEYTSTLPNDCNLVGNTTNSAALSSNVVIVKAADSTYSIPGFSTGSIKFKVKVQE